MTAPTLGNPNRDRHFDGLRGIAALVVVVEHLSAFLPFGNWVIGSGLAGGFVTSLVNCPFRSGAFAVYLFFVISGFVIAKAAQNKPWPLSLLGRYLRLTVPMLAASLAAWILLECFPAVLPVIKQFNSNHWTDVLYQTGAQSFFVAVWEPIFRVYRSGEATLNPVLWTMRLELFGSLGILTFYRFVPQRYRATGEVLIAIALTVSGHWRYIAFAVGAAIFERNAAHTIAWRSTFGLAAITAGLALNVTAGLPQMSDLDATLTQFVWYSVDLGTLLHTIGAALVVVGVTSDPKIKTLLERKIPQFLGRISYSLYLIHLPLLLTAFAALYLYLGQPPSPLRLAGWTVLFAVTATSVAWWMTVWVDEPVTRLVKVKSRRLAVGPPIAV